MRESEVSFIFLKTKCRANIKSWMSKTMKLKSTNSSYTVFFKLHLVMGKNLFVFFFFCQSSSRFSIAWLSSVFLNSERAARKITCKTRHIANTIYARITSFEIQTDPLGISTKSTNNRSFTSWPYAKHLYFICFEMRSSSESLWIFFSSKNTGALKLPSVQWECAISSIVVMTETQNVWWAPCQLVPVSVYWSCAPAAITRMH